MKRSVKLVEHGNGEKAANFGNDELLHVARLVTIGELSACFGHEVTNPLMLIRGHLRFMDESLPSDHPLRSNLEVIDRASRRIDEMARTMLDFSRKRAHQLESCDVGDLVADAVALVEPYVRTQFIDVRIALNPRLPALQVDRWQIIQALVNLLQNAAHAMTKLESRILSISGEIEQGRLQIAISDTGKGIHPDCVGKIFDPFFTTKGEQGTGLGLYITKQVVEQHRGTITVQTGQQGTTFRISLPV